MSPVVPEPTPASPAVLTVKICAEKRVRSSRCSKRGSTLARANRFFAIRVLSAPRIEKHWRKNRDQIIRFMVRFLGVPSNYRTKPLSPLLPYRRRAGGVRFLLPCFFCLVASLG